MAVDVANQDFLYRETNDVSKMVVDSNTDITGTTAVNPISDASNRVHDLEKTPSIPGTCRFPFPNPAQPSGSQSGHSHEKGAIY